MARRPSIPHEYNMTPDTLGNLLVRRLCNLPAEVYIGPDINTPENLAAGVVMAVVVVKQNVKRVLPPTDPLSVAIAKEAGLTTEPEKKNEPKP